MADALAPLPTKADIRPERPEDAAAVAALIDAAFGPGRYAKAAERLREGRQVPSELAFTAWDGDRLVGGVRLWPIHVGPTPALLLGPIAVDSRSRSRGLGAALTEACCGAAAAAGHGIVLLVGDASFFAKAGFVEVPRGALQMPGPVDGRRLLWKALRPGAVDGVSGPVTP